MRRSPPRPTTRGCTSSVPDASWNLAAMTTVMHAPEGKSGTGPERRLSPFHAAGERRAGQGSRRGAVQPGPQRRTPPAIGIASPLTFRSWARGDTPSWSIRSTSRSVTSMANQTPPPWASSRGRPTPTSAPWNPAHVHNHPRQGGPVDSPRHGRHAGAAASGKSYLGLTLPGRSLFTPMVISATPQKMIVARVAEVDDRRDVQILEGGGEHWDFVGTRPR